jgi:hypothetical protein
MSLLQEFKEQFEEKYKDIIATNFSSIKVTDGDLAECFADVMINDAYGDVDEAVNDGIVSWIEGNKEDEIDIVERIANLETTIEDTESNLENLKEELENLKEESNSWGNTSSVPIDKNETWDGLNKNEKW